jgi:hypothetical protein
MHAGRRSRRAVRLTGEAAAAASTEDEQQQQQQGRKRRRGAEKQKRQRGEGSGEESDGYGEGGLSFEAVMAMMQVRVRAGPGVGCRVAHALLLTSLPGRQHACLPWCTAPRRGQRCVCLVRLNDLTSLFPMSTTIYITTHRLSSRRGARRAPPHPTRASSPALFAFLPLELLAGSGTSHCPPPPSPPPGRRRCSSGSGRR